VFNFFISNINVAYSELTQFGALRSLAWSMGFMCVIGLFLAGSWAA
jgi:uncharacterized MAPEG superfamily protein